MKKRMQVKEDIINKQSSRTATQFIVVVVMFICVVTHQALNIAFACAIEKNENITLNTKNSTLFVQANCTARLTASTATIFLSFFMLPQQRNAHIYLTRCFQMKKKVVASFPQPPNLLFMLRIGGILLFVPLIQHIFMNELKRIYFFAFNENEIISIFLSKNEQPFIWNGEMKWNVVMLENKDEMKENPRQSVNVRVWVYSNGICCQKN